MRSRSVGPVTVMAGRLLLLVLVASMLLSGAGPVAAHDNVPAEPGASGSCQDGDQGGAFAAHGPGDHENNLADEEEAESAAQGAVYAAETRGECGDDNRYFEAHVISAAVNVQYCYSEESDGDEGDTGNGDDGTDNVTTGAGAGEVNVNDGTRNYPPPGQEDDPQNEDQACEYNSHNEDEEE